jgi:tetratricopeptide (TPR) repeat protein
MKHIFLCTIILLSYGLLPAQPISSSSYETKIESAAKYMEFGNYAAAREVLDEAYDDREDPELIPILAEANMKLRDYRQAESWYRRLLRRDRENTYAELRYDYAEALKMQGKYDDAIQEYQQYLALGKDPAKKTMAQLALTGAELAISMSESTKGVSVEALDRRTINTRTSEYSPALSPTAGSYITPLRKRKM